MSDLSVFSGFRRRMTGTGDWSRKFMTTWSGLARLPDQAPCEYENSKPARDEPGMVRKEPLDTGCIHLYNLEMRKYAPGLNRKCCQCAEDQKEASQ